MHLSRRDVDDVDPATEDEGGRGHGRVRRVRDDAATRLAGTLPPGALRGGQVVGVDLQAARVDEPPLGPGLRIEDVQVVHRVVARGRAQVQHDPAVRRDLERARAPQREAATPGVAAWERVFGHGAVPSVGVNGRRRYACRRCRRAPRSRPRGQR